MDQSIILHKKDQSITLFPLPEKDTAKTVDGITVSVKVSKKDYVTIYEVTASSDEPDECYLSAYCKSKGKYYSFNGELDGKERIFRQSPHELGRYHLIIQGSAVPMTAVSVGGKTTYFISDNPSHCLNYTTQRFVPEKEECYLSSGDMGGTPNFVGDKFDPFYHQINKDNPHIFRFITFTDNASNIKEVRRSAFIAIEKVWGNDTGSVYAAQCFSSNYMHIRTNESGASKIHIVPGIEYANTQYHRDAFWQSLILPDSIGKEFYKSQSKLSLAGADRGLFYVIWSYRLVRHGETPDREKLEFALESIKKGLDHIKDGRYCPTAGCDDGSFRNWFDICCFEPDDVDSYSQTLCVCALRCGIEMGYKELIPYYEKAKVYCSKLFNGKFIQLSLFKPYLCLDFACGDILNYYLFGETFLDDDAVKKTYETVMNGKAKTPWGVKIVALPDGEFLPLEGFMAGGKVHPEMKMHPYGEYANGGSYHIYEMLFHMDAYAHHAENALDNMIWRLGVDFNLDGTTHEHMNTATGEGDKANQGWNAAIYAIWDDMCKNGRADKKFFEAAEEILEKVK